MPDTIPFESPETLLGVFKREDFGSEDGLIIISPSLNTQNIIPIEKLMNFVSNSEALQVNTIVIRRYIGDILHDYGSHFGRPSRGAL